MDELEGTLRGHIGIIEEALDRLEGKATEADRGKKMYVQAVVCGYRLWLTLVQG